MKVGVIRLSSLGDVVLATSCLKPLREAHPDCEIVFVTKSEYVGVFENNQYLNGVISWSEREPFKSLLARVRAEKFDVLLDLHSTPRTHSITALSGAGKVIRYKKAHLARKLSVVRKKKLKAKHVIDRYMEAVGGLGVQAKDPLPAVYPDKDDLDWVSLLLTEHGHGGDPVVAIAPGGRRKTKRWPAVKFARLASELVSELGATVVMLGDEGDMDAGSEIRKVCPGVIDTMGKTDIGKLGALLLRCDLAISNDSAPVHLAAAVGTHVVAIFGPTVTEFGFAPCGRGNVVIERDLYCRPCSLHGTDKCPEGHFRCMEDIGWDEVYDVAARLLKDES